jgi:hypothetical protein
MSANQVATADTTIVIENKFVCSQIQPPNSKLLKISLYSFNERCDFEITVMFILLEKLLFRIRNMVVDCLYIFEYNGLCEVSESLLRFFIFNLPVFFFAHSLVLARYIFIQSLLSLVRRSTFSHFNMYEIRQNYSCFHKPF